MVRRALAVAVLGLAAMSCHTITEELPAPTTNNPNAPGGIPVIVIPVPVITPTPTPAGTPTPAPGPNPTPAPPQGSGCGLPAGNGSGNNCPYEHASFQDDVETAIDNVIRNYPRLFDMRDDRCPSLRGGCPRILDADGYWEAVTNEVRRLGLCAVNDGEELAVKNTNSWNDQYDVYNGEGWVRRGAGSYRSTCHPAWF